MLPPALKRVRGSLQAEYWRARAEASDAFVEYGNDVEGSAFCDRDPLGSTPWNMQACPTPPQLPATIPSVALGSGPSFAGLGDDWHACGKRSSLDVAGPWSPALPPSSHLLSASLQQLSLAGSCPWAASGSQPMAQRCGSPQWVAMPPTESPQDMPRLCRHSCCLGTLSLSPDCVRRGLARKP